MRIVSVDQFEFDDPSTEESLELAISARSTFPHSDVRQFVGAAVGEQAALMLDAAPSPFRESHAYGSVRDYAGRFAGVSIPLDCDWPTYVLADGPDEWHLVLCSPTHFISYRWWTAA